MLNLQILIMVAILFGLMSCTAPSIDQKVDNKGGIIGGNVSQSTGETKGGSLSVPITLTIPAEAIRAIAGLPPNGMLHTLSDLDSISKAVNQQSPSVRAEVNKEIEICRHRIQEGGSCKVQTK